ncbi:MAG: type IVB secretion system apparatus protein IcmL/DotI [Legionellaceae bacterium]|nr:type IVB secretion system apparatus protein IcmL/DotI [Legionellaceae bacterium]
MGEGMPDLTVADKQPWMQTLVNVSLLVGLLLAFGVLYLVLNPLPEPYYLTTVNGQRYPLTALDEPNQSERAILEWANQGVIAAFNYNFYNYDLSQTARGYFTERGWTQFISALDASNNIDTVRAKRLIVSAVAYKPPVILRKGPLDGRYSWRVQMPILITYSGVNRPDNQHAVVTLLITRISTQESVQGIGITDFNVGTYTGVER